MPQSDSSSASWSIVAASASGSLNSWTQLTGVFNAAHGTLTLYVNGNVTSPPTASASPWSVPLPGHCRIGADLSGGAPSDYFDGSVSDLCVFYGVLNTGSGGSSPDVQNLYDSAGGDGCSALNQSYP